MVDIDSAKKELYDFLSKNPKYIKYQDDIDRILNGCISNRDRQTALLMLMAGKLDELKNACKSLHSILTKIS